MARKHHPQKDRHIVWICTLWHRNHSFQWSVCAAARMIRFMNTISVMKKVQNHANRLEKNEKKNRIFNVYLFCSAAPGDFALVFFASDFSTGYSMLVSYRLNKINKSFIHCYLMEGIKTLYCQTWITWSDEKWNVYIGIATENLNFYPSVSMPTGIFLKREEKKSERENRFKYKQSIGLFVAY